MKKWFWLIDEQTDPLQAYELAAKDGLNHEEAAERFGGVYEAGLYFKARLIAILRIAERQSSVEYLLDLGFPPEIATEAANDAFLSFIGELDH